MFERKFVYQFLVLVAFSVCTSRLLALDTSYLYSDEFEFTEEAFRGHWQHSGTVKSYLCEGKYHYDIRLGGKVEEFRFDVDEKGNLKIYVDVRNLVGSAMGDYRSHYSLCTKVGGSGRLAADRAEAWITVLVIQGETPEESDFRVKVDRTHLTHLMIGNGTLPDWFENFMTDLVNKALKNIWGTWLGDELEKMLTKFAKEKFLPGKP